MIVNEGFDGMSMQKLAKSAGVSPATLYIYYRNREDMLEQLYEFVQTAFANAALKEFDPTMNFEKGLWVQWKNRMRFIEECPHYFRFFEQFRNSPQINRSSIGMVAFKDNMHQFVSNAVKRGEIRKVEPEIFWSLAYGSFYSLLKFHLQQRTMMNPDFKVTDAKMKQLLNMVVKSLKP